MKECLVTVGSTRFDVLVRAAGTEAFAEALVARGVGRLVIQRGEGGPHVALLPERSRNGTVRVKGGSLEIETIEYDPNLAERLARAALVVCHAGAGTIFEALSAGRCVVAVPNPALMGDHQASERDRGRSRRHAHPLPFPTMPPLARFHLLDGARADTVGRRRARCPRQAVPLGRATSPASAPPPTLPLRKRRHQCPCGG